MKIEKAGKEIIKHIAKDWNSEKTDHLHFDDGVSFVAKIDDQITGFISGRLGNTEEFFIDIIDVKPNFRRQGIGKKLVGTASAEALSCGAKRISAWSTLDKEAAIAMWKALGFELNLTTKISAKTNRPIKGYVVTKEL